MWDIRRALSCWMDKGAKIDKFLNYCHLLPLNCDCWWFVLPAAQSFLPVHLEPERPLASDVIVSSAGTSAGRLILDACGHACGPSWSRSGSWDAPPPWPGMRNRELGKTDLKMSMNQKTLRSCLCQQFFPATSSHPWQKSLLPSHTLDKYQTQLWTKHSQIGMHEHSLRNWCTGPW